MIQATELSDKFGGAEKVDYFGMPVEDYLSRLIRELQEVQQRAAGRVLTLDADPEFGCPGGVIEEWGGRLHFPERGSKASVLGRITSYQRGYPYVIARIGLRNEDPTKPDSIVEGCFVFPDGSALLPIGGGAGQLLDVLGTFTER